jgi:prefoldin subunit 5
MNSAAVKELITLRDTLCQLPSEPAPILTNIGFGVHVEAVPTDPSHAFVSVGSGFFVCMSKEEAIAFLDQKIPLWTRRFGGAN